MTDRLYRLLLLALPADLRRDFGDDMARLFADHRRAARTRAEVATLCVAAAGDVLKQAAAERLLRWPRPSFSPKVFMRALISDFRHGLRLLRRYPSTSLLAVLTLALGIGANTAIFSVVDAVMLRALPYPEPDRLVMVWEKRPAEKVLTNVVSPADFVDWQRRQTPFHFMAAHAETAVTLTGQGEPRSVDTGVVTARFFDVLQVRAAKGRTFREGEDAVSPSRVAVITHGFWQRVLGGDDGVVGKTLTINGNAWEVIGVLPADFKFLNASLDIWVPMVLQIGSTPPPRASHQLSVYARLKPGVSLDQARDAMDRLGKEIEAENPDTNRGHGAWVTTMREEYVGPVQTQLALLFGAVGLVLLIACVNVANLLLARAASRRREMGVRTALGATRGRLIVQNLSESLAISFAGCLFGVAIAYALVRALPIVLPEQMSVVTLGSLTLDARVLGFALLLAFVTGMLAGSLPALSVSGRDVANAVKEGGRGASGIRRGARRALVVSEVALATLALVGGGLVLRSFMATMSQSIGFATDQRLTITLSLPGVGYATPDLRRDALADLERRLASVPGVKTVGGIDLLPLDGGDSRTGITFEGREPKPDEPPTRMHPRIVTPSYFAAMGIPILRGRAFTDADAQNADPVVIISEASVRRFWPDGDALNKRIRFNGDDRWRTIVGIAGDVRHWGLTRAVNPMLYWPQAQANSSFLTFVLHTNVDPLSVADAVRAQVAAFDPKLPAHLRPLQTVVGESVRGERAQTILMGAFGLLGLALAVIGIYGVMAQLVTARIPEIGVRMTLGARPAHVLRQLLGEGFWQTAVGVTIGLALGSFLMTLGATVLFQTQPWDPATLAGVAATVIAAALAACFVPARRAMKIDPVAALRQ